MTPLRRGTTAGRAHDDAADAFPEVDGSSSVMRALKHQMLCVADDGEVTVLILGESGTGKERIARAIHDRSPRCGAPFVIVNCAGLAPTLVEDELFGHVRGAFTGAVADRAGPFERAAGGTVFLDEIGDLLPDLQMKLLRVLQERQVQRLGGRQETAFDARVIAATNVDLAQARASGRFRDDLYFRLKVYELRVPPLRHRGRQDVRALSRTIIARLAERRRRAPPSMDAAAMEYLGRHRWPGNIRELENTLERMIVAAGGGPVLGVEHLPEDFASRMLEFPGQHGQPGGEGRPFVKRALQVTDREVAAAIEANGFNRSRAAASLGLSRHQLYRRVKDSPALGALVVRGSVA